MEEIFNSVFGALGQVTGVLRDLITSVVPEYVTIVLLGLSLVGGFFLHRKYPHLSQKVTWILYGLIIFLLLKFVQ